MEYKFIIAQLSVNSSEDTHDDILLMGNFNCYPGRGGFIIEFSNVAVYLFVRKADIYELPANGYTYISLNASVATSLLDRILLSRQRLVP